MDLNEAKKWMKENPGEMIQINSFSCWYDQDEGGFNISPDCLHDLYEHEALIYLLNWCTKDNWFDIKEPKIETEVDDTVYIRRHACPGFEAMLYVWPACVEIKVLRMPRKMRGIGHILTTKDVEFYSREVPKLNNNIYNNKGLTLIDLPGTQTSKDHYVIKAYFSGAEKDVWKILNEAVGELTEHIKTRYQVI